jgi:hypothetical protein
MRAACDLTRITHIAAVHALNVTRPHPRLRVLPADFGFPGDPMGGTGVRLSGRQDLHPTRRWFVIPARPAAWGSRSDARTGRRQGPPRRSTGQPCRLVPAAPQTGPLPERPPARPAAAQARRVPLCLLHARGGRAEPRRVHCYPRRQPVLSHPAMAGFVCAACTASMPGGCPPSTWRTCARWLAMLSFCRVSSSTSRWAAARRRSASALTSVSS